jgi:uncharacterized protein (TIGR03067 family)
MSRQISAACALLLSCLLAGCGAGIAADPAEDAKLWQGTWTLVAATENGQRQTADLQWVVSGDHYNIRLNGVFNRDPYKITLDATHKQVDVFHHDTPQGTFGGSLKGIYEVQAGSLKVCFDPTARSYPSSFDAGPGSRRVTYEFRRAQ